MIDFGVMDFGVMMVVLRYSSFASLCLASLCFTSFHFASLLSLLRCASQGGRAGSGERDVTRRVTKVWWHEKMWMRVTSGFDFKVFFLWIHRIAHGPRCFQKLKNAKAQLSGITIPSSHETFPSHKIPAYGPLIYNGLRPTFPNGLRPTFPNGLRPTSFIGLWPTSFNGLWPTFNNTFQTFKTSNGLRPTFNGLRPTFNGLRPTFKLVLWLSSPYP